MSVLVSKRSESRLEVIVNADGIQDKLDDLIQRNFGIKRVYELSEEEKSILSDYKREIHASSDRLANNVRSANTIDGNTTMADYTLRRCYQNMALCNCQDLIRQLQKVISKYDLDINRYESITNVIYREIDLIKGWRQRDNRMKKRIKCVI